MVDAGEETLVLGNPQELERLEQEEQQSDLPGRLWDGFRKRYPKIQAFDSANGCEILTIKPQDIGLLPRENWNYGNNSFLLHGYYNYRYLILARIGDETKGAHAVHTWGSQAIITAMKNTWHPCSDSRILCWQENSCHRTAASDTGIRMCG